MSVYSRLMQSLISRKEAGFTLLEVMIAIVILSVGLLALATMQISAVRDNTGSYIVTDAKNWGTDRYETLMTNLGYDDPQLQAPPGGCTNYTPPNPPPGYTITYQVCADQIVPDTKTITMTITGTQFGLPKRVQLVYVM